MLNPDGFLWILSVRRSLLHKEQATEARAATPLVSLPAPARP